MLLGSIWESATQLCMGYKLSDKTQCCEKSLVEFSGKSFSPQKYIVFRDLQPLIRNPYPAIKNIINVDTMETVIKSVKYVQS